MLHEIKRLLNDTNDNFATYANCKPSVNVVELALKTRSQAVARIADRTVLPYNTFGGRVIGHVTI